MTYDRIKLATFDVDSTLTTGHMVFDHAGNVSKAYHTRDMSGLWKLQESGVQVLILTGSNHPCDRHRFQFLQNQRLYHPTEAMGKWVDDTNLADVLAQGVRDKLEFLDDFLNGHNLDWKNVAYMGDDTNDFECMKRVGWPACPADAIEDVKSICQYVSTFKGGQTAVRDFAEMIISANERNG